GGVKQPVLGLNRGTSAGEETRRARGRRRGAARPEEHEGQQHACTVMAGPTGHGTFDSVSGKKYPISKRAVSGESDPWTALCSIVVPYTARIVPGSAFAGSVAPIRSRCLLMASSPSSTSTTTGPEAMNLVKLSKNGRLRWTS